MFTEVISRQSAAGLWSWKPGSGGTGLDGGGEGRTFVLALLGCPDAAKSSEDACFHLSHRTWHSAMVTIMGSASTLGDIREQVMHSRLSHVPTNFCFLFNGHALDPNVEATIKAESVAIVSNPPDTQGTQYIVLIDNVHCNIGPKVSLISMVTSPSPSTMPLFMLVSFFCSLAFFGYLIIHYRGAHATPSRGPFHQYTYNRVPSSAHESQSLIDADVAAKDDKGRRIPCLPHSRLRTVFKAQSIPRARPGPSPMHVDPHCEDAKIEQA